MKILPFRPTPPFAVVRRCSPLLVLSPTNQIPLPPFRRCWCYHQQHNTTCSRCPTFRRCWCYHQPTKYHFRRSSVVPAVVGVITNNPIPPAAVVQLFRRCWCAPLLVLSPKIQYHLQDFQYLPQIRY